ncbi:MAG: hypothetical protein DRJ66_02930 [Thermoprotei archaeon]|nr:MAG: hypothetical protein DRJ66_02930 [Thermoprotei archaeon]RLF20823.1 MAG: hypothetical protein DRZ82_00900 [Thermoprotei archaeon]
MSRYDEIRYRVYAVEALRTLKGSFSYQEIARRINLPPQTLSRYVTGKFLPPLERCHEIIKLFKEMIKESVKTKVRIKNGVIDVTQLISDVSLMKNIARVAVYDYGYKGIDGVITKETDGIPIATLIASELNARLVVAKEEKEVGVNSFIEVRHVYPSGLYRYLYVPKALMKKGENFLIVDDIIRTGSTVMALYEICKVAKVNVKGIFAICGISSAIDNLSETLGCPVNVVLRI